MAIVRCYLFFSKIFPNPIGDSVYLKTPRDG